jgi:DNA (cytosine-5)-methyltransferase 1
MEYLSGLRAVHTQKELSRIMGVDIRTIRRWEQGQQSIPGPAALAIQASAHLMASNKVIQLEFSGLIPDSGLRFIDLFAGIGGFHAAFTGSGAKCVFTSEWDKYATQTYSTNAPEVEMINGDITKIPSKDIPEHDILVAGFPCQPFSIAGVSKKNSLGRPHGFADLTQGTLFFDVARILYEKRPKAFLLENVKNLRSHDNGRTLKVIMRTLEEELGYEVHIKVIDGQAFTPQHRERIFIVGFAEPSNFSWDKAVIPDTGPRMGTILHKSDGSEPYLPWDENRFFDHGFTRVQPKYTLTPNLWAYLQNYAAKHRLAGNGFGFGLVDANSVSRTLSARYYKDGSEILVKQSRRRPRRLTPRECARLMGYPDTFQIPVSDTQAYKQFGNSVVVPVARAVAQLIMTQLNNKNSGGT